MIDTSKLISLFNKVIHQGWLLGVVALLVFFFFLKYAYNYLKKLNQSIWNAFIIKKISIPSIFFIISVIVFLGLNLLDDHFRKIYGEKWHEIYLSAHVLLKLLMVLIFSWIVWNFLEILNKYIQVRFLQNLTKSENIVYSFVSHLLRVVAVLILINAFISHIGFVTLQKEFLEKISIIFLICLLWYGFYYLINVLENLVVNQYTKDSESLIYVRKIKTQVLILKRIILTIISVILFSSALMIFEGVRNIGAGLLTTAGIISAVGALATQQSLMKWLAGLQLAFTQPVRIGDTVIVEKEFGEVEEISLSYVVVKLWDLRRLILPTDYIISKGIQNLTRTSSQLLGSVFLYVDYSLPVSMIRESALLFIKNSLFWDKNVAIFQVTEMKESCMEIRMLMSAANASDLWSLRCEVREQVIDFISKSFPDCLPKVRLLL